MIDERARALAEDVLQAARDDRGADADMKLVALRRRVLRRGTRSGTVAAALAEASEHFEARGALVRAAVTAATVLAASPRVRPDATERLERLRGKGAPVPLGVFTLNRRLDRGANAEVWKAHHLIHPEPVAIKLVVGRQLDTALLRASLERELRVVAGLSHPHIVGLLDHGVVDIGASAFDPDLAVGTPWIALELATEGNLTPRCGRLAFPDACRVLQQLLAGLAHAHAHGVLHLDVKPSNVLVMGTGSELLVQLADFGIARAVGDAGPTLLGTPQFMAPEQFASNPAQLGAWTDLYGLGCLAFVLLTGRVPYGHDDVGELAEAHRVGAIPDLPPRAGIPPAMARWVGRLLQKQPADRPASAAEAALALEALSGMPRGVAVGQARHSSRVRDAGLTVLPLRAPPLVGRAHEQALLQGALRASATGATSVVVLEGPPGVGVRRLGQWLACHAEEHGLARAGDGTGGVVVALRALLRAGGDGGALRRQLAVALPDASRFDVVAIAQLLERGQIHGQAGGRGAVRALRLAALARPLVWRVTDSAEGLAVADAVLQGADRVLVIVERASVEPDPRVEALLEHPASLGISVPLLSPSDLRALLRGWVPLQADLRERIVRMADGNPRRAIRRVQLLADQDVLELRRSGLALAAGVELPELDDAGVDLARVIEVLGTLPMADRVGLAVAALLGTHIDPAEWRAACEEAGLPAPDTAIDHLMTARLAVPSGTRFAFVDRLVRDSLRPDGVSAPALHAACASALRARGADDERIADHLRGAGDLGGCRLALERAIQDRLDRGLMDEAAWLADQWRGTLDDQPAGQALGWLLCVDVARSRRDVDRMRDALASLDAVAEPGERLALRGRIAMARGELAAFEGDVEAAMVALGESIQAARASGDAQLEAMASLRRAMAVRLSGDVARALRLTEQARAQLIVCDPEGRNRWSAEMMLARMQYEQGRLADAEARFRAVLDATLRQGRLIQVHTCLVQLGGLARARGDREGAHHTYREALRVAEALGMHAALGRLDLALLCFEDDEDRQAEALVRSVLDHARPTDRVIRAAAHACQLIPAATASDAAWQAARDRAERRVAEIGYRDADLARAAALAAARADRAGFGERARWLEGWSARVSPQGG